MLHSVVLPSRMKVVAYYRDGDARRDTNGRADHSAVYFVIHSFMKHRMAKQEVPDLFITCGIIYLASCVTLWGCRSESVSPRLISEQFAYDAARCQSAGLCE